MFDKLGAADEKARSSKVFFSFKLGYFKIRPLAERRLKRGGSLIAIKKYFKINTKFDRKPMEPNEHSTVMMLCDCSEEH